MAMASTRASEDDGELLLVELSSSGASSLVPLHVFDVTPSANKTVVSLVVVSVVVVSIVVAATAGVYR